MPEISMSLREAVAADAPALAAVQIATWRAAYVGLVPDDFLATMDHEEYAARWVCFLGRPEQRTLVGVGPDGIGGYCSFGPSRDADHATERIGELYAVYVHPRYWRGGLGRMLCKQAMDLLRAAGFRAVSLWAAEANARAHDFYATLGFADDGGRKIESAGAPLRHVRLRRSLAERQPAAMRDAASMEGTE